MSLNIKYSVWSRHSFNFVEHRYGIINDVRRIQAHYHVERIANRLLSEMAMESIIGDENYKVVMYH